MEQRNETGGLVLTSAPAAAALFCKHIILVERQWLAKVERTGPRKRCLLLLLSFAGSEGRFKSYGNFGLPPKQRRVLVCVWGYEVLASVCLPLELFWSQPCLLYVEEIRSMVGMPDSRIPRALWKFWTKRNTIERERTSRAKDNRRHSWNIVCCAITAGEICLQPFPNESLRILRPIHKSSFVSRDASSPSVQGGLAIHRPLLVPLELLKQTPSILCCHASVCCASRYR